MILETKVRKEHLELALDSPLGRGALANVFLYRDARPGKTGLYAVKEYNGEQAREQAKGIPIRANYAELQLISQDPRLVRIHSAFYPDHLVLELVKGYDLKRLISDEEARADYLSNVEEPFASLSPHQKVCHMMKQIINVLHLYQQHDLVDLDLKLSNLMLATDGTVKPVDMDLLLTPKSLQAYLSNGSFTTGTFAYMPLEQLEGWNLTSATNVFKAGMAGFEATTGTTPLYLELDKRGIQYTCDHINYKVQRELACQDMPNPLLVNPLLHPHLGELILRMIHREADKRIALDDAQAMVYDLKRQGSKVVVPMFNPSYRAKTQTTIPDTIAAA